MTQKEFNDKRDEARVQIHTLALEVAKHVEAIAALRVGVQQLSLDSVSLDVEHDKRPETMTQRYFYDTRNAQDVQSQSLHVEIAKRESAVAALKARSEQLELDIVTARAEYDKSRPIAPSNCTYATMEDTVHAE